MAIRDDAEEAAQAFRELIEAREGETSGIPRPVKIVVTETQVDVEPFDFKLDRGDDKATTTGGQGGGGGSLIPPETGACCLPDSSCADMTDSDCVAAGGTWHGAGVPCSPSLCDCLPDISVSLGPGAYTGCAATVDSATYGPWGTDMAITFSGHVDDDVRVNGIIVQEGEFAFTDCESCPCPSSNGNNGEHSFSYSTTLPAGTPLTIELLNWFSGNCFMSGTIHLCPTSLMTMATKTGRGTKVARYAKPIARGIDAVAGTNFQNCAGCIRMERNLNAGMSWGDAIYDRFWPKSQQRRSK